MNSTRGFGDTMIRPNKVVNGVRYDTELDARRARLAKLRMRQAPTNIDYLGTQVMIGEGAYLWNVFAVNEDGSLELEKNASSQVRHRVLTRTVKFVSRAGQTLWAKN